MPVHGALWLDDGAVRAVRDKRKSLFAPGVARVVGDFSARDAVALCDADGREFARGLVNYSAEELRRVRGKPSAAFAAALGYVGSEEVVFRANTALLVDARRDGGDGAAPSAAGSEHGGDDDEDWEHGSVREGLAASLSEAGALAAAAAVAQRPGGGGGGSGQTQAAAARENA